MATFNWPINPTTFNAGAIEFQVDGIDTVVNVDTLTPANSTPLPIKALDGAGIEVDFATQTTLASVLADTNTLAAVDYATETTLAAVLADTTSLDGKDFATETTLAAVLADTTSLDAKDFATETTLAALNSKDFATEATLGFVEIHTEATSIYLGESATGVTPLTVSVTSSTLPTGAATETTLSAQSTLIGAVTETAPATDTASSGLNGRLQRIAQRITSLIALVPASLGQKTMANSFAVTMASDQTALPSSAGRSKVAQLYNDYTLTAVTTAAYVQLTASTSAAVNKIEIFDSSGETLILAVGGAGSEVDQLYIFPGGNGSVDIAIPASSRISVKSKTATASTGLLAINLYS